MKSLTFKFTYLLPIIAIATSSCSHTIKQTTSSESVSKNVVLSSAKTPSNLNLSSACALAVQHHPSMATYPMDRRAADARILKASRSPNPELTIDMEDFLGLGGSRGFAAAMLNTALSGVIERGGKKEARVNQAKSDGVVMDAEYAVKRLELLDQTSELFFEALAAHENVKFSETSLERSKETLKLLRELDGVGRVTATAVQQVKLDTQKLELELVVAKKARSKASRALTGQWGDSKEIIFSQNHVADVSNKIAPKKKLMSGLSDHPSIMLAKARVAQSDSNLRAAKSNNYRDLAVSGGVRANNDNNSASGLLALSIPLKFFDRNKEGVVEMSALTEKSQTELLGAQRELNTKFELVWSDLDSSHKSSLVLKNQLLPTAIELLKGAETAFREGAITSLEFLAAQQQFQTIRNQWLRSKLDYQLNAARIQNLTNQSL